MTISSLDFLSPKITLNYKGNSSHSSRIGGLLSLCLFVLLFIIIFYYFWEIFHPTYFSSFISEINEETNEKIIQKMSYSEINHFIQIYSNTNNGNFGDIDNKNIIIYAVKDNKNNNYHNKNYFNLNLSNIEHWLYDRCDKIYDINGIFSEEVSKNRYNFASAICIRFYFNPIDKQYYEIGNDGFVEPFLETYDLNEKKYPYNIIIEKCINNTFINDIVGYKCNTQNEINHYLDIYNEIFIYISNNKVVPFKHKKPYEKYYYSISSTLHQMSYFKYNIFFLPLKIIKNKGTIMKSISEYNSYILNYHYNNERINNYEYQNLLGIFSLYLDNKILTYQILMLNILDVLSDIGGLVKISFFIFQTLNYFNHRYTIIENTKNIFSISSGIDSNVHSIKDLTFDIKQATSKNYKLKQYDSNCEISPNLRRIYSPASNKKKLLEGATLKSRYSCSKNNKDNKELCPINLNNSNKNNNSHFSKQNTITLKKKKIDKRQSYLSQGYRVKIKDQKDNSVYIKNKTFYDKESLQSNINNPYDNNSNYFVSKENFIKLDTFKNINNEISFFNRNRLSKKMNLNVPSTNNTKEKESKFFLFKKSKDTPKIRHKSINYTNEKKMFRNSFFNKNHLIPKAKNSSEIVNDSSNQILVNNKNLLISINNNYNKTHRFKFDDNCSKIEVLNNAYLINSTKNLNNYANIGNEVNNPLSKLILLIKNKLKADFSEVKEDLFYHKKIKYLEYFKSLFICYKKTENKIGLINDFRIKLLSEEHLYRNHINLYLIQKIFQIDEAYNLDVKELYINL